MTTVREILKSGVEEETETILRTHVSPLKSPIDPPRAVEEKENDVFEPEDPIKGDGNQPILTPKDQQNFIKSHGSGRKRKKSTNNRAGDQEYFPNSITKKQRFFMRSRRGHFHPSIFLLGGNYRDPLNLASLKDEKVNEALNKDTPKSSPTPVPPHRQGEIPVLIPKNPEDPLGLQCSTPHNPEELIAGVPKNTARTRRGKKRAGRRRTDSECSLNEPSQSESEATDPIPVPPPLPPSPTALPPTKIDEAMCNENPRTSLTLNTQKRRYWADPIVSPVIPQNAWRYYGGPVAQPQEKKNERMSIEKSQQASTFTALSRDFEVEEKTNIIETLNKEEKWKEIDARNYVYPVQKRYRDNDKKYQYGNYNRYYGYRNSSAQEDPRLRAFNKKWFKGKNILDIGCNVGHITLTVGRDFEPSKICGIDIDEYLVQIARRNTKHYVANNEKKGVVESVCFPQSFPTIFGSLHLLETSLPDPKKQEETRSFPYNVMFKKENYVLETDEMLGNMKEEYDVILCLSITKWIHLNNGDDGLKRFFRRTFLNLRPGGILILEPQPWSSYKRKKKLTPSIFSNYQKIKFQPDKFCDYLINEVGFKYKDAIGPPSHHSKGFQRPIYIFTKGKT